MAVRGVGFFDSKGQYYKTPHEATLSDLAGLLGRMGDGDSLAPGIAKILFEKRREIEHVFRDHDDMVQGGAVAELEEKLSSVSNGSGSNVTHLSTAKSA
jgi:hypothetical protein